jgi:hypothetical protein
MKKYNIIDKLIITFISLFSVMMSFMEASVIDPSKIIKNEKIKEFSVKDADIFECCSHLWQVSRSTVLPGDDPNDLLMSSFGFAVYFDRASLPKKTINLKDATLELLFKEIARIYETEYFLDEWYVIFSNKKIIVPLIDSENFPKDSELGVWSFPNTILFEDFSFKNPEHQKFLLNVFQTNPSIGDVHFVSPPMPKILPANRLDVMGRWRYAEFFELVRKTSGDDVLIKKTTAIEIR